MLARGNCKRVAHSSTRSGMPPSNSPPPAHGMHFVLRSTRTLEERECCFSSTSCLVPFVALDSRRWGLGGGITTHDTAAAQRKVLPATLEVSGHAFSVVPPLQMSMNASSVHAAAWKPTPLVYTHIPQQHCNRLPHPIPGKGNQPPTIHKNLSSQQKMTASPLQTPTIMWPNREQCRSSAGAPTEGAVATGGDGSWFASNITFAPKEEREIPFFGVALSVASHLLAPPPSTMLERSRIPR